MTVPTVVTCLNCEKKFKPKNDVRGKKIKCPFCEEFFVVPADKAKPDAVKAGKPKPNGKATKPEPAQATAPPTAPPDEEDLDGSPDPYAVKHVELVPRCPNCTEEMGEHDIICLACGYNTLTRSWGKTEKKKGNSVGRQFQYLLPALGSAAFIVFTVIGLIFYAIIGPYLTEGTMFSWTDGEWLRMWTTVMLLSVMFGAGVFCMKKFIEKPQPDELELE